MSGPDRAEDSLCAEYVQDSAQLSMLDCRSGKTKSRPWRMALWNTEPSDAEPAGQEGGFHARRSDRPTCRKAPKRYSRLGLCKQSPLVATVCEEKSFGQGLV